MNRRKKIKRIFLLFIAIYIILNVFIFGLMTAYINTNNMVSSDKIVMAELNKDPSKTSVEILGNDMTIKNSKKMINKSEVILYTASPQSFRIAGQIVEKITQLADIVINKYF